MKLLHLVVALRNCEHHHLQQYAFSTTIAITKIIYANYIKCLQSWNSSSAYYACRGVWQSLNARVRNIICLLLWVYGVDKDSGMSPSCRDFDNVIP
mmetsp:Transcript_26179/g.30885  ORF Transcript_26179/g.30885 Transcript_26179/m.30885 type:complete len:96 (-) Transcript_26179:29-316(-)